MQAITLSLRAEDAEPILRKEAYDAAKYGSMVDHIPRKCWNHPKGYGVDHDKQKAIWSERFLRSKRIVESFGIDYEPVSEAETITLRYEEIKRTKARRNIAGMTFREIETVGYNSKKFEAHYISEYHSQACQAAADRAVRRWRESLNVKIAA